MNTLGLSHALRFIRSRQFFTLWFGFGIPPFLIGTVIVAFRTNVIWGTLTAAVVVAWLVETFVTTCRRCPFYGSAKCGIPSLVTPLVFAKVPSTNISVRRVRLHYYADLAMIAYVNVVYWLGSALFPVVLVCSFVGWLVVYRRKKFHGLLFRLDRPAAGRLVQVTIRRERPRAGTLEAAGAVTQG